MNRPIVIDTEHPALPGHFPGNPVVPGVVILEYVKRQFLDQFTGQTVKGIKKLKFLRQLKPTESFSIDFADIKNGGVRFTCLLSISGELLAEGHFILADR